MADYEEFKTKAKETIETIADATVETYKVAEEKAKILAKKTKLRAGVVNEKATVRRLSVELGATYYKLFKDSPAPEFEKLCVEITAAYERIADKERQIEELKASAAPAPAPAAAPADTDTADTGTDTADTDTDTADTE